MSYDKKFREKAIKYYEKGHTFKQTANIFELSTNTLNNWLKQKRETGNLQRKYLHDFSKFDDVLRYCFNCN